MSTEEKKPTDKGYGSKEILDFEKERWIVTDRADGANVNNWHWSEKVVSGWFQELLKKKLEEKYIVQEPDHDLKTTSVYKMEVDAVIHNRKNKVNIFLEGSLTLDFEGSVGDDSELKGSFALPDLEASESSPQIDVSMKDDKKKGADKVKDMARGAGKKWVQEQFAACIKEFRNLAGIGDKGAKFQSRSIEEVEKAIQSAGSVRTDAEKAETEAASKAEEAIKKAKTEGKKEGGADRSFSYKIEWGCPASEIFTVLTDPGRVQAFTRAPCVVQPKTGGEWSVLSGSISGSYTNVVPNKELSMTFRASDWPSGKFSNVKLSFDQRQSALTVLTIDHTDIPENDFARTRQGWKQIFWDPIRMIFGFSMNIVE